MIAKLSGRIDSIGSAFVVLDVGGVGYLVHASALTLQALGKPGETASLRTEMVVREDGHFLYGFATEREQEWFRLLTGVQGVGARTALAILGICPPDRLVTAIAAQDKAPIQRADGVGPKLATRIVTELKDKAARQGAPLGAAPDPSGTGVQGAHAGERDSDAVSALVNLGYGRPEAFSAVGLARAKANENDKIDTIIRLALKELSARRS